ncbi:hypothetical protein Tco_0341750, partial [Tanacetum coccineum]
GVPPCQSISKESASSKFNLFLHSTVAEMSHSFQLADIRVAAATLTAAAAALAVAEDLLGGILF